MNLQNVKSKLQNQKAIFQAKCLSVGAATGAVVNKLLIVHANENFAGAAQNADPNTLVNKAIVFITDIFRYIGIMLLAWAIGMLVMAFKNEDADSKSRAMMMAVCSIMLIGIKTILMTVLGMS